jgi:hypothetical protein
MELYDQPKSQDFAAAIVSGQRHRLCWDAVLATLGNHLADELVGRRQIFRRLDLYAAIDEGNRLWPSVHNARGAVGFRMAQGNGPWIAHRFRGDSQL